MKISYQKIDGYFIDLMWYHTMQYLSGTERFQSPDRSSIRSVRCVYSSMVPSNISLLLRSTWMKTLVQMDNCYILSGYASNDSVLNAFYFFYKSITHRGSVLKILCTHNQTRIFSPFLRNIYFYNFLVSRQFCYHYEEWRKHFECFAAIALAEWFSVGWLAGWRALWSFFQFYFPLFSIRILYLHYTIS